MTAQFIDNLIFILCMCIFCAIPLGIVSAVACVILDVRIKKHENNNYLGRGKEKK